METKVCTTCCGGCEGSVLTQGSTTAETTSESDNNLLEALTKLRWMEVDTLCTQTLEATNELCKLTDSYSPSTVQAVIRSAFYEGKTVHLSYVLPAHSSVVQALLNMSPASIKKLYAISTNIPNNNHVKLRKVVSSKLNPLLLDMTVSKFKSTVELLYYMKEYFLSLFGTALVNVTCKDKCDVLLILSQLTLTCNLCDSKASDTRLFQCVDCNVSSVCINCMQTEKGHDYLHAHSDSCVNIQKLIKPLVESMTFVHLCENCYAPLHKNVDKNHFNPNIRFERKKKKSVISYGKAQCTFAKCKRNLCAFCVSQKCCK